MEKFKEMGAGSTGRLLFKYSLPAIAGMILVSLYNVIDRIFVGQATGATGLAAVTVAFPVMMLGFAGAILANAGGSSLISRLLGAGDKAGAEKALGQSVLLGAVLSGLTGLLLLPFLDPILWLFGASEATIGPARQFSQLMIAAFPFQGMSMGLGAGVRSQGKAKTSMFLMLAGVGVNAILCGVFVMAWGWGVPGSAWATFFGQLFSCAIGLAFYLSGAGALRFHWRNLRPDGAILRELSQVGMGAWLGNVIPVALILILNRAMVQYAGDTGLAIIGIVNTVGMLAVMPVFGIMQGAAPIMGYNHGAGDWRRVRRVFFQGLAASTVILTAFWLTLEIFPDFYIKAFSANDPDLIALGQRVVAIFMVMLPLIGLPIALGQYYQSIGLGLASAILGMARQIIFLIPALLIMPMFWGLDGLIWAGPVADALGVLLALGFFLYELPKMKGGRLAAVPAGGTPAEAEGVAPERVPGTGA
jgi:putative MATE family efflux protein